MPMLFMSYMPFDASSFSKCVKSYLCRVQASQRPSIEHRFNTFQNVRTQTVNDLEAGTLHSHKRILIKNANMNAKSLEINI